MNTKYKTVVETDWYRIRQEVREKITWKTPIRKLAWQILMPIMERFRIAYNSHCGQIKSLQALDKRRKLRIKILEDETSESRCIISRLDNLVNEMNKDKGNREYVFDVEQLNKEEQEILGNNHDHPVVKVLMKSFKAKADENNDKLVHFQEQSEFKRAQWALAIRVYDDLVMQMKTFGMYETKKAKKAEKEANY